MSDENSSIKDKAQQQDDFINETFNVIDRFAKEYDLTSNEIIGCL